MRLPRSLNSKARIAIAGVPRAGKTTLALSTNLPPKHTDSLIKLGWSPASAAAALWFNEPGPWVVEGVAVPRALRKWLQHNPDGQPADLVVFLHAPVVELTEGQRRMGEGCGTVWRQIRPLLMLRGVGVTEYDVPVPRLSA